MANINEQVYFKNISSQRACIGILIERTHSISRMISAPLYSIERKISVVMMRQDASGRKLTSPVSRPTSNFPPKSRNFWLLIVFIGEVYTARVHCCNHKTQPLHQYILHWTQIHSNTTEGIHFVIVLVLHWNKLSINGCYMRFKVFTSIDKDICNYHSQFEVFAETLRHRWVMDLTQHAKKVSDIKMFSILWESENSWENSL